MKKAYLLAATLAGALTTAPGMAKDLHTDFRALSKMPTETILSAMTTEELSQVEGGVNQGPGCPKKPGTQCGGSSGVNGKPLTVKQKKQLVALLKKLLPITQQIVTAKIKN